MATSTLLYDLTAKGYAKAPVGDEESYQKKLEITRSYLRPDMDVMEFGCGTGTTAVWHAPTVRHIQAYDVSAKMLEIARGRAADAGVENVTFEQADISEMKLPDAAYDVVMGHSILHLVKDKDAVIAQVMGTLKPGGLFVSSTTCLGESSLAVKMLIGLIGALPLMPPIRRFTKAGLRQSMKQAGFEIEHDWAPHEGPTLFLVARKPVASA